MGILLWALIFIIKRIMRLAGVYLLKTIIETLEKGMKYVQSLTKDSIIDFFLMFLLLTLNIFHIFL